MASKAPVGLLKRAWNEIPEIVGSTLLGLLGVGMGLITLAKYKDGDNRPHKFDYIVIRSDDPLVKTIKD